jgi:hypothetical protein
LLLRSVPSPEVDAAWEELTNVGVIIISGDEVSQLGKDLTKTVKAPKEWGLCFPVLLEIFSEKDSI